MVEAYVIPKMTSYNPVVSDSSNKLDHIVGLLLAYSGFCKRGQIEILLGASVHVAIIDSCYFLPHHGVLKNCDSKTKLQTVFNDSAKGFNSPSINDLLHTGANLLPDLTDILIN